ncbi:uncharacterized protein N7483_009828 [Penicillium malachiteum]|uniref:uncharacterized protein n=1 Tax=Penicillium malachiteum TaxID=1324776 RepID=UPI0025471E0E|nr:uncharacterized protein N7483_009828 [Penicillium malachiteum]KAJ5721894.1 hypothetical protein N7483_009828 [Penicillium malachiteum]
MRLSTLGLLFLVHLGLSTAKTCYAPDGTAADNDIYAPCIAIEGVQSMCCRINDTNPDTCLASGLCYTNGTGAGYWRDFCTDETWESPNCLSKSICNTTAEGNSSWTYIMTACGSNKQYCCGDDTSCCGTDDAITINDTLVAIGGVATATATATNSVDVNGTNSGSSDESTKLAIGFGVALPLTALAGAMLGAGFLWGRKKTQRKWLETKYPDGTAGQLLQPTLQQGNARNHHPSICSRSIRVSVITF